MAFDIFISYRRIGGYETAKHLYDLLRQDGYRVSFDIDTLRSGDFDVELLKRIEECTDFIVVLNKGVFDRCFESEKKDDWLRNELAYALEKNKNVIPIMLNGFEAFPDNLPDDITRVQRKNGPKYDQYYFDEFYVRLKKGFLEATPKKDNELPPEIKSSQYFLKIHPNLTCNVWVDGELKIKAEANCITKLPLNKGTFFLEFVSETNNADKYSCTSKIIDTEEYIAVDIESIARKRIERERIEEERIEKEKIEKENASIFSAGNNYYRKGDYSKAIELLKKSAEQGYAKAQNHLGFMYYSGQGVNQDNSKALEWFKKAAEQGLTAAQNNLGATYENDLGVNQDYSKALEWYNKAAEQGDTTAQNNLGLMYKKGRGVNQDFSKAVEWFKKAAVQGLAIAQYHLGLMYDKGQGVDQNYSNAVEWYRKAAEQGNVNAINALKNLEQQK